jgi:hypothetical protein
VARLGQNFLGDTFVTLIAKEKVAVASMCVQNEERFGFDLHSLKSESRATLTPVSSSWAGIRGREFDTESPAAAAASCELSLVKPPSVFHRP